MNAGTGKRSRKDLACTAVATAYQKEFGANLKRRVVENGDPFVVAQADTPHEIFHAMDIPVIANQWWSAYISAKQLSRQYFNTLSQLGFPDNTCRYCSLGLACTLANDPGTAPWGGLPRPTALVARLTCDCIQRVFEQWADALGTEFFAMEAPAWQHKEPDWFRHSRTDWERVYEPARIALMVEEMRDLIRFLESRTARRFDMDRFRRLMERINEQESYIAEAATLVGSARPCPVSIAEQMSNTMIPQWHRGSDWAVNHARRFRDEVLHRVQAGIGCASRERLRLMWIGAGLWHDPGFYQALEERCGAVFVWSMYMPFAGPQYIRDLRDSPLEALASRICSLNEVLHLPPWMNGWMVSEAERCGIDAAVILKPSGNRLSQSGTLFVGESLRSAGVPVLMLDADMVDAANWDHDAMVARVENFLLERGLS
ncbi:MAG: 2-hydroxyacyl-CoA dehydratase family protein [Gammaproteobacteria bacterium]|nr:2-hydroxyacyl-CoA dehydratase family protein [Gammaproteobacteria bacterium]MDH4253541.1 2-hydroxyacyl-CoA dehydratase family protein [Gammaproteobacteria bacterium]MDH5309883.1 2-hydroxyacyl-CoA dehydratase family protein [Gammaproteobacteria bacterium]